MDPKTIPDLLRNAHEVHRKSNAFLVRRASEWMPVSIDEFTQQVELTMAWLRAQGVSPGDRVAILSESRYEWSIVDLAIVSIGAISVPIYPTLPVNQISPLIADADVVGAFVSSPAQREKLDLIRAGGVSLPFLWSFDAEGLPEAPTVRQGAGYTPQPDDVATIIYTSGTTGTPKGVMLTHSNVVAQVLTSLKAMPVGAEDIYLSFLPLSHVFERCSGFYTMLYAGVTIAYAESFDRLSHNLREVRPTVILAVPRLYEKVLSKARETAAGSGHFTLAIFQWAYRVAIECGRRDDEGRRLSPWLSLQHALASMLVYRKIARGLGGRTRLRVSGGAPLNREIALFYRGVGLPIHEGYGLTETSSAICVNTFARHRVGTVGPLFDVAEVRFAKDGEILVRGPLVMKGYWRNPAATAEALEGEWFHTGDIGDFDQDGFLRITDRKKDLLVTSGGKKVAPQPIEAALKSSPRINEALVIGDGRKFMAALIVPAPGATKEAIAEDVERVNGTLAQFERIKRFELVPDDLTVEKGFMTPSLKLKRKAVLDHHREVVERLFQGA